MRVIVPHADVRKLAWQGSDLETQALHGEEVEFIDHENGWYHVKTKVDNYYGYIIKNNLVSFMPDATHRVCTQKAVVRRTLRGKAYVQMTLGFNSLVTVDGEKGSFFHVKYFRAEGWIHKGSLVPVDFKEPHWVDCAERFADVRYKWGGRDATDGVDCSGLIHNALTAAGFKCPRDSKDMRDLGINYEWAEDYSRLFRGLLVFFPGHVGVMLDEEYLLHSTNVKWQGVVKQKLVDVIMERNRHKAGTGKIVEVRRLPIAA
jgi:hypothetical protein